MIILNFPFSMEASNMSFQMFYESYFNTAGTLQFVIQTTYAEAPLITVEDEHYIFRNQKLVLNAKVEHFICTGDGAPMIIKDLVDLVWTQKKGDENLGVAKQSVIDPEKPFDGVEIRQYITRSRTQYIIGLTARLRNIPISVDSQIIIK